MSKHYGFCMTNVHRRLNDSLCRQVENFEADNLAENIANAVKASGTKIDGVFTHTENLQPIVGQVCEILGIKNNPYSAYEKYGLWRKWHSHVTITI